MACIPTMSRHWIRWRWRTPWPTTSSRPRVAACAPVTTVGSFLTRPSDDWHRPGRSWLRHVGGWCQTLPYVWTVHLRVVVKPTMSDHPRLPTGSVSYTHLRAHETDSYL